MVWSGHANQKFIAYPILKYPTSANQASSQSGADDKGKISNPDKSLVNWIAEICVRFEEDCEIDSTSPAKVDWLNSVPKEKFAGAFKEWTFGFLKYRI